MWGLPIGLDEPTSRRAAARPSGTDAEMVESPSKKVRKYLDADWHQVG